MTKVSSILFVFVLFQSTSLCAQKPSDFLPEKPGKWTYSSNLKTPGTDYVAFNKNLVALSEWFHQNIPIMANPRGFDLSVVLFGAWDDKYKKRKCNYGIRGELNFGFQMFFASGSKWTVEPPAYEFDINNTGTGHGTNFNFNGFDNTEDDPSLEVSMNKTAGELNDLFQVFQLEKEIVPGVS